MTKPSVLQHPVWPLLLLSAGLTGPAHAGRPLNVDDAGVVEPGTGQVEAWYARQPGGARGWTVAPAYSPGTGLELTVSLSQDNHLHTRSTALQGKFLLTPSRPHTCNVGVAGVLSQTSGISGNTPSANGLLSCNHEGGASHFNLGVVRASGGPTARTWGLATEREFGRFTGHVEWYGQQRSAPVFQLGLRTEIAPDWQVDGSLGRTRLADKHETLYSLGFVYSF